MRWFFVVSIFLAACDGGRDIAADNDQDGYDTTSDCDDEDPDVFPEAPELCDGIDNDCDGSVDEDPSGVFFADADGDGHGDASVEVLACEAGPGISSLSDDCDDSNGAISPSAPERCDGLDNDCDGDTDEDVETERFTDADGDGFGDPLTASIGCNLAADEVDNGDDCDDTDATIHPDAYERCDGVDNNCDGSTDGTDAIDARGWYADADADGFGTPFDLVFSCDTLSGRVANDLDCDDSRDDVYAGAPESCDVIDHDCDGTAIEDNAADAPSWFLDVDGDGYGDDATARVGCTSPGSAWVTSGGDCDELDSAHNPATPEYCDGVDTNCNGLLDDGALDGSPSWPDLDGDGYGDADNPASTCSGSVPSDHVLNGDDCDDSDATVNPDGSESCDGRDEDCDGMIDNDVPAPTGWFPDTDGDGYGDDTSGPTLQCDSPGASYIDNNLDCDDGDPDISPAADERCDPLQVDEDCSGANGDGAIDGTITRWRDADGDGEGATNGQDLFCSGFVPTGWVDNNTDCNDSDPLQNSASVWYWDADNDGYGDPTNQRSQCNKPNPQNRWALRGLGADTDCQLNNPNINPGATEVCVDGNGNIDDKDDDCDGVVNQPAVCPDFPCPTSGALAITTDTSFGPSPNGTHFACDVTVSNGATLSFTDGANITFGKKDQLVVGANGSGRLMILGDRVNGAGVRLGSAVPIPSPGDWDGVHLGAGASGSVLQGFTIAHAGRVLGTGQPFGAGIWVEGADVSITDGQVLQSQGDGIRFGLSNVDLRDVEVIDALFDGFNCVWSPCFPVGVGGVTGLVASGNGGRPMVLPSSELSSLDPTNSFSGNGDDAIEAFVDAEFATDTTLWPASVPYRIVGDLYVRGSASPTLTLEDGVDIQFSGGGMVVGLGNPGALVVHGFSQGVTLRSDQPSPLPGDWSTLFLGSGLSSGSSFDGLIVRDGGSLSAAITVSGASVTLNQVEVYDSASNGISVINGGSAALINSTLDGNAGSGFAVDPNAVLALLSGTSIRGSGAYPVEVPLQQLGLIDGTNTLTDNAIDRLRLRSSGALSSSFLLGPGPLPYAMANDLWIDDGLALTLSDDVDLLFEPGAGLYVGTTGLGSLTASAGAQGISLHGDGTPGSWDGVHIGPSGAASLLGVSLSGGGGVTNYGQQASVEVDGGSLALSGALVADSLQVGVYAHGGASFNADGLVIQGTSGDGVVLGFGNHSLTNSTLTTSSGVPLRVEAAVASSLDGSNTLVGNGIDVVRVEGIVDSSAAWSSLGVPWRVSGAGVSVEGAAGPVLTLSSGAVIEVEPGAGLDVGSFQAGDLLADGVLFTSAQPSPAPGDWCGLQLGPLALASSLSNSELRYGGSSSCGGLGNLYVNQGDLTLSAVSSRFSASAGITFRQATGTVSGCVASDNASYGLVLDTSPGVTVSGCSYGGNGLGDVQTLP